MKDEQLTTISQRIELPLNGSTINLDLVQGRLKPKIATLGPDYSYTHEASAALLGSVAVEPLTKLNEEVVGLVVQGTYDAAVIAGENAIEGDVVEVQKALYRNPNVRILGEIIRKIDHMLIGKAGEKITHVLSHPQALGQCRRFLETQYPHATQEKTSSTTAAVEAIKERPGAAAIAGRMAAEKHGLPILHSSIGDNTKNATRFYLIGRGETSPTGNDVTTLSFVPRLDRSGLLRDCLTIFADAGINLNDISSRPTGELGFYAFKATFDGHEKDPHVQDALKRLQDEYSVSMRIWGSYAKAIRPEGTYEPGAFNGS